MKIVSIKNAHKAEVQQTKAVVSSSTGGVDNLVKKSEKLREVIDYLKKNIPQDGEKGMQGYFYSEKLGEFDDILAAIGDVSLITK